jgi:hypothetical protein
MFPECYPGILLQQDVQALLCDSNRCAGMGIAYHTLLLFLSTHWAALTSACMPLPYASHTTHCRHSGTTLVIIYAKPPAALRQEEQERQHRKELKQSGGLSAGGEAPECKQS